MINQLRALFAAKPNEISPSEAPKEVTAERKIAAASLGELMRMTRGITDVDFPEQRKNEAGP